MYSLQPSSPEFLLLSATSYDIAHLFCQFGSAVLTLFTSSFLANSALLPLGASEWEEREGVDTVQALLISSQNTDVCYQPWFTHTLKAQYHTS